MTCDLDRLDEVFIVKYLWMGGVASVNAGGKGCILAAAHIWCIGMEVVVH